MTVPARLIPLALATALLTLAPAAVAGAATITPTPGFFGDNFTNDDDCSLREAISIANEDGSSTEDSCVGTPTGDDVVQLEAGTYVLDIAGIDENDNATGDLDVDTTNGDLTIAGAGAGQTTIDTDDAPAWADRVLDRAGFDANALTVRDLTVTGGNDTDASGGGGGINSFTGTLVLERVRIRENASNGGGAGVAGGGGGSLSISDSVIELNSTTAPSGGGLQAAAAANAIDSTVIDDNSVTNADAQGGGGISGFTVTLTDSLVTDNKVTDPDAAGTPHGGGLSLLGGSSLIRGSTIGGNEVLGGGSRSGGALRAVIAGTSVTLLNSTVSGNEALGANGFAGGITGDNSASVTVAHSTIGPNPAGNTVGTSLRLGTGAALNVRGSIVAAAPGTTACSGVASQDDNVFADTSCGAEVGNDVIAPDPTPVGLADNGGPDAGPPGFLQPIPTHLPASGSPVVDHVPFADCKDVPVGDLTVDQRGLGRPVDRDGDSVAECDAGSVELQALAVPQPDVTVGQQIGENPECATLRERLRKLKRKIKRSDDTERKAKLKQKRRKVRKRLAALGC